MPRTLRLDEIRLRCQRRADKESDPSIGTAEWNALMISTLAEAGGALDEPTWIEAAAEASGLPP